MYKFMKGELRRELSKIGDFENPKISLEQYVTPPDLAADLLFTAYMQGDLGKVADLGTGTGILAIGAALLDAEVVAVEKDEDALNSAKENAEMFGVKDSIDFRHCSVEEFEEASEKGFAFDCVVMNPPFSQHTDVGLDFWDVAASVGEKVYSVSPATGREGIKSFIDSSNHRVIDQTEFRIDLPATYGFHTEESRKTLVDLIITEAEHK